MGRKGKKAAKNPSAPATPVVPAVADAVVPTTSETDAVLPADNAGYIRKTIESESVEKTISYLSSYAPALMGIYGQVKENLPETVQGHISTIETEYVLPYTEKGLKVANETVTQVDDIVLKTESKVRSSIEDTKRLVTDTVQPIHSALENRLELAKATIHSTVEPIQQKTIAQKDALVEKARPIVENAAKVTSDAVYTTVGTGLDTIDSVVDYILPVSDDETDEADPVEPIAEISAEHLKARVGKLSAKLVTRLERLSLVAAIHKSKLDATKYMTEKRASTTDFVKEKYNDVDENYVKPSRAFLLAKYEEALASKAEALKQWNDIVIVPTTAFVEGFKKESWSSDVVAKFKENLPNSREGLRLKLVEGYVLLQKSVLHPAADYVGIADTFKAYEELVINKVVSSIQTSSLESPSPELVDPDAEPELWHDAPSKVDFDKMVPLYPTDESPMK